MVGDKDATDCSCLSAPFVDSFLTWWPPLRLPSLCVLSPLPSLGCAGWLSEDEQTGALCRYRRFLVGEEFHLQKFLSSVLTLHLITIICYLYMTHFLFYWIYTTGYCFSVVSCTLSLSFSLSPPPPCCLTPFSPSIHTWNFLSHTLSFSFLKHQTFFATKLFMAVHHCEPQSCAVSLECYIQDQGHSEHSYFQRVCPSSVSFHMLYSLLLYLICRCVNTWQTVMHKDCMLCLRSRSFKMNFFLPHHIFWFVQNWCASVLLQSNI